MKNNNSGGKFNKKEEAVKKFAEEFEAYQLSQLISDRLLKLKKHLKCYGLTLNNLVEYIQRENSL